jgi:hypothetical protein
LAFIASCCTALFNGFCRLCLRMRAALFYVGFHCLSLHVSAYMAIFKSVGFFIYLRILLRCFFLRGHTLRVFHLCFVPVLFSFVFLVYFVSKIQSYMDSIACSDYDLRDWDAILSCGRTSTFRSNISLPKSWMFASCCV